MIVKKHHLPKQSTISLYERVWQIAVQLHWRVINAIYIGASHQRTRHRRCRCHTVCCNGIRALKTVQWSF
jgi:hypothetical protein